MLKDVTSQLRLLGHFIFALVCIGPNFSVAAEGDHPRSGYDPKRRVESDEVRRREEGKNDERRSTRIEQVGRDNELRSSPRDAFQDVAGLEAKIKKESNTLKFDKVDKQIEPRGWTREEMFDLSKKPRAGTSVDNRNGRSDPASVYGDRKSYMVVNDVSKEVVQISDKTDPNWVSDSRIKWN